MVVHALNVLAGLLLLLERGVDVLVAENLGRHGECVSWSIWRKEWKVVRGLEGCESGYSDSSCWM